MNLFHPETHGIAIHVKLTPSFHPGNFQQEKKNLNANWKFRGKTSKLNGLCKSKKKEGLGPNASACLGYAHPLTNSWGQNPLKGGEGLTMLKSLKSLSKWMSNLGLIQTCFPARGKWVLYTATMYLWTLSSRSLACTHLPCGEMNIQTLMTDWRPTVDVTLTYSMYCTWLQSCRCLNPAWRMCKEVDSCNNYCSTFLKPSLMQRL